MLIRLSKSRFLAGQQCELRLWYETYAPHLAVRASAATQALFATGHEVGELARDRYPGGIVVQGDYRRGREAVATTRELLAAQESTVGYPALFEAGFEHQGVLVRTDILLRAGDGAVGMANDSPEHAASDAAAAPEFAAGAAWTLLEVKSSTGPKAIHDLDLAIQLWVLRGAGLSVRQTGVLTLDRRYVWPGGDYDLDALFRLHDRTQAVEELLPQISADVAQSQAMLARAQPPSITPGAQCTSPYDCPYLAHCTRDLVPVEWPLSSLPSLHAKRREALEAMGIVDVRDIPVHADLNPLQELARDAVVNGVDVIHGDLAAALSSVEYPVHHLDFETVGPAIPRYPNTRAYDIVPFQFSLHTEYEDGTSEHLEYLHPDGTDPREPLARALLAALGETGSIVVYSAFEKRVINLLSALIPNESMRLRALLPRLWDLHPVVKNNYYHPEFRGSFSIKSVLPVLVPELSYDELQIADGRLAAVRYLQALDSDDVIEREHIFGALREYCGRDTLALLQIRRALEQRARVD